MTLQSYAICGLGHVREENQDNLYVNGTIRTPAESTAIFSHANVSEARGLYAVADGMGGGAHGGLASFVIVQEMITKESYFFDEYEEGHERFLLHANGVVCDLMKKYKGNYIGSTFAGLCINQDYAIISNIGDSRIYLFRKVKKIKEAKDITEFHGENLHQLTLDHTATQRLVEMGILSKEAARNHPDNHRLTQHIGIFPSEMVIEPYCTLIDIHENDIFLLCSDGLTDMLTDKEIEEILITDDNLEEKANKLFAEALNYGGKDNITIILVCVTNLKGG